MAKECHRKQHIQVNKSLVILGLGGEWLLVVFTFLLGGRHSSQGRNWVISSLAMPPAVASMAVWWAATRVAAPAAPQHGPSMCESSTLISGHERASSQSPHSWTLHTEAANRKKKK